MARLAIRATGDKNRRENVTTGDTRVEWVVYDGNKVVRRYTYSVCERRTPKVMLSEYDAHGNPIQHTHISETHSA
jgi:hypothetical protein